MRILLTGLILVLNGCVSSEFYVKESVRMGKVSVTECRVYVYKNLDTNKTINRNYCKKGPMSESQKDAWLRLSTWDLVPVGKEDEVPND